MSVETSSQAHDDPIPPPTPGSEPAGDTASPTAAFSRVEATPAAQELLRSLVERNGPVMFHQSGGCCDGSAPMCYPAGEFWTGDADIHLQDLVIDGVAEAVPFWMSRSQYEYWDHTHLTVDVVKGRGSGFSLEAPEGVRFLIRSRLMTDAELAAFGLS